MKNNITKNLTANVKDAEALKQLAKDQFEAAVLNAHSKKKGFNILQNEIKGFSFSKVSKAKNRVSKAVSYIKAIPSNTINYIASTRVAKYIAKKASAAKAYIASTRAAQYIAKKASAAKAYVASTRVGTFVSKTASSIKNGVVSGFNSAYNWIFASGIKAEAELDAKLKASIDAKLARKPRADLRFAFGYENCDEDLLNWHLAEDNQVSYKPRPDFSAEERKERRAAAEVINQATKEDGTVSITKLAELSMNRTA